MGTQGLIERNNLGIGNVNTLTTRYVLGYNMLYRLLTFMSKLNINLLFFVFDYNISYYNKIKDWTINIKGTICVCFTIFFYFFNLGAQIRGTQTWYTVVNLASINPWHYYQLQTSPMINFNKASYIFLIFLASSWYQKAKIWLQINLQNKKMIIISEGC